MFANAVAVFRMVIWVFGITAPELSRTTPVMVPVSTICARSAAVPANNTLDMKKCLNAS
jgi:hypothetical protein